MKARNLVMIDYSAFMVLLNRDSPNHGGAKKIYERLLDQQVEIWSTNYILLKLSMELSPDLFSLLCSGIDGIVHIYWVGPSIHEEAEKLYKTHVTSTISLLGLTTLLAAREIGARLFTFDSDLGKGNTLPFLTANSHTL
jgi:hypothetical protein